MSLIESRNPFLLQKFGYLPMLPTDKRRKVLQDAIRRFTRVAIMANLQIIQRTVTIKDNEETVKADIKYIAKL